MRCAHCGHSMRFRDGFQFRLDGGHRCSSCRKVYFLAGYPALRTSWPIVVGLLFAGAYLGFIFLLAEGLNHLWIAIPYWAAVLAVGQALFMHILRDAPTAPSLPNHLIYRRRWLNVGLLVWMTMFLASLAVRGVSDNRDLADYVGIAGGIVAFVCLIIGFAGGRSTAAE